MQHASEALASAAPRARPARAVARRPAPRLSVRCAAPRPRGPRPGARPPRVGVPDYSSPSADSRAPSLPEVTPPAAPQATEGGGAGGRFRFGFGSGGGGSGDSGAPRPPPLLLAACLSLTATAAAARGFGPGNDPARPAAVAASATDALAGAATRAAGHQMRSACAAVAVFPERLGSRFFAKEIAREAQEREAQSRNPFAHRWPAADELPWPEEPPQQALPLPSDASLDDAAELLRVALPPAVARAAGAAADWARALAAALPAQAQRIPIDARAVRQRADGLARAAARNARVATKATARTLRVTGFAADAATGAARAEVGGRFVLGDTPCVITCVSFCCLHSAPNLTRSIAHSRSVSAPAPGVVPRLGSDEGNKSDEAGILVTLRGGGYRGVLRLGGGLVALDAPAVTLREGLTLRPEWRGGVLPTLHATWLPQSQQLPAALAGGASAVRATLDAGRGGAAVAATHARRTPAGNAGAGAAHAARLTLRCGLGALGGAAAEGVYKLKMPREGLTLGAAVDTGGRRAAPAVAFLKLRHQASGGVLRLTSGLAARVLAAELALPDAVVARYAGAAGGATEERGRWHAALTWRDGRVAAATLTRRVAY
jgi:hypothetical protein